MELALILAFCVVLKLKIDLEKLEFWMVFTTDFFTESDNTGVTQNKIWIFPPFRRYSEREQAAGT